MCYHIGTEPSASYAAASASCRSMKARLASPDKREDWEMLGQKAKEIHENMEYWTGNLNIMDG